MNKFLKVISNVTDFIIGSEILQFFFSKNSKISKSSISKLEG